ncbi:hypothetical protein V500_00870 [Pseudogymnoascus sp. VKM F-4518 (FW-2643)]|nr:hypothetical protein V500_00870 [Pseudogymnoascus sp. VKM F-4518 (FW-2643)]
MDRSRPYPSQREPGADDRHAGTEAAAENHPVVGVVGPNEPTPSFSTRRSANGRVQSQASAENRRQQFKKYSVVIVAGEGADPDEQSQAAAHLVSS